MKIYTKNGDQGDTQLIGKKVKKTHDRVEAYGTVDELNSSIGLAMTFLHKSNHEDMLKDLTRIQHELFDLGGDLANVSKKQDWAVKKEYIDVLEKRIDNYWEEAPPIHTFILPGGEQGAAQLHVCRTIARRAERLVVKITDQEETPPHAIAYLNRLSDYFFAAARAVNARAGTEDILYERGKDVFK
ncbi:ATP:cob(I)alamin adenosyltransferase [Salipaludibacillus keqinensis]|uniref:Corrinoid adenosyltransferase n=1 Tax=Salipaludibacillus keqinensis TaxID=2045207 RepID=A0A323THZ5_9BACI|nr:cob(I)yrinic acid a,c-diamide adenosyltransferase [Salipaludibacillus keqinensis]PYZ94468.1 ATP:cob(I)alamin adenosyltransferase [Salipaludibacillus keqinensis]